MQPTGSPSNWEQQVLAGPAKPLSLYLCSHGHLNRNTGTERPHALHSTANKLQRCYRGCVASTSSQPFPWASSSAGQMIKAPYSPQGPTGSTWHIDYHLPPTPCRVGLSSLFVPGTERDQVTDQDTRVCTQALLAPHFKSLWSCWSLFSLDVFLSSATVPTLIEYLLHKKQHARC